MGLYEEFRFHPAPWLPHSDLSLEELRAAHPAFDEDVYEAISLSACVERRSLRGGPAPSAVEDSIQRGRMWMTQHSEG